LRTRRGDLTAHAPDGRRDERLLRASDGEDGGGSAVTSATEVVGRPRPEVIPRAATVSRARRRRIRRAAWNVVGLAVFVVLVFPVFWMVSTAFKPDAEINSFPPTWISGRPTLEHFRDAIAQPYFW